jgi:hypothetical protein
MPGENEIIASVTAAQENSAFDVTQFAERTEETSNIVPVAVVTRCGTEVSILVHKDTLNDEGQLNPKLISVKDMQSIIDEHKICYVESCMYAKWIRGSVFFYSEYDATWLESDICMFGILPNGDEGYFSREQDYVECYDTNVIYYCSETASDDGCYWCDRCEEYRSDSHSFDSCGDEDNEYFDNMARSTAIINGVVDRTQGKTYGNWSPTYTMSNGMRHTFGVEIETSRGNLYDYECLNLKAVYDGSTSGPEYVTGVLHGDYGYAHLKKICNSISDDHEINQRCGVHVHIGGQFNRVFTIMLLRLGYKIQDEIFRMMPPSRLDNTYCKFIPTWAGKDINFQNWRKQIGKYIYAGESELDKHRNKKCRHDHYASTRYRWININNFSTASGKPTVEFRCHGASMNYEKIRNWVLICKCIVSYAENNQKKIWYNIHDVTLKDVILEGLGENLGKQVYTYYTKRVTEFAAPIKDSGKQLPSQMEYIS